MKAIRDWNDFDQQQGRIGYEFEHRFNSRADGAPEPALQRRRSRLEYSGHYSIGADQPLQRYWGHYTEDMKNFIVDNMAQFEFDTGEVGHTALGGIEYSWSDYDADSGLSYVSVDDIKNAAGSSLRRPGDEPTRRLPARPDGVERASLCSPAAATTGSTPPSTAADRSQSTQKDERLLRPASACPTRPNGASSPMPTIRPRSRPISVSSMTTSAATSTRVARPTIATQKEIGVKYAIPDHNAVDQRRCLRHRPEGRRRLRRLDRHQQAAPARPQLARRRTGGQCLADERLRA